MAIPIHPGRKSFAPAEGGNTQDRIAHAAEYIADRLGQIELDLSALVQSLELIARQLKSKTG